MVLKDQDIRELLFEFLEERYGKIRIIEEKSIGESRADIVMVMPGQVVGIEIKSDADSYTRLSRQITDYDTYFDANIIVVGSTHALHVAEHVPSWWGIISAEWDGEGIDFYVIREMTKNPECDLERKIRILWRPELAHIQELCHLPAYKAKSKEYVRTVILDRVPENLLQEMISEELFERDYTRIAEIIRENSKRKTIRSSKRKRRKRAGK